MKPALTDEEWKDAAIGVEVEGLIDPVLVQRFKDGSRIDIEPERGTVSTIDGRGTHALAALCLHGQPFGFTREDVDNHRMMAEVTGRTAMMGPEDQRPYAKLQSEWHTSMADRIEALLPPEDGDDAQLVR